MCDTSHQNQPNQTVPGNISANFAAQVSQISTFTPPPCATMMEGSNEQRKFRQSSQPGTWSTSAITSSRKLSSTSGAMHEPPPTHLHTMSVTALPTFVVLAQSLFSCSTPTAQLSYIHMTNQSNQLSIYPLFRVPMPMMIQVLGLLTYFFSMSPCTMAPNWIIRSLIPTRYKRVSLWDNPFDDTRDLSIEVNVGHYIHVSTNGTQIQLLTRTPTPPELANCQHLTVTSLSPWEPSTVQLQSINTEQLANKMMINICPCRQIHH